MKITIYSEICCDYCSNIVHNHIDCPVCNTVFAETDSYYNLVDDVVDKHECVIECQKCKAKFRLIGDSPYCDYEDQWERMEE